MDSRAAKMRDQVIVVVTEMRHELPVSLVVRCGAPGKSDTFLHVGFNSLGLFSIVIVGSPQAACRLPCAVVPPTFQRLSKRRPRMQYASASSGWNRIQADYLSAAIWM